MKSDFLKATLAENLRNYQLELVDLVEENTLPTYRRSLCSVIELLGCVQNEFKAKLPASSLFLEGLRNKSKRLLDKVGFLPTAAHALKQAEYGLSEMLK